MKILLEIPDAFAEHFAMDKFKDSFMRICGDLGEITKSHSTPGAASLYKRNKRRSDRALAAKDILSAHVTHFSNGSRELCLVPAAGKGAMVSVSLHFARG